jgi:tRNA U55 pseudouridine synthase TruB
LPQHLQPALVAVSDLPRIELNEAQQIEIRNGRPIAMPPEASCAKAEPRTGFAAVSPDEWAVVNSAGELVAILREKHDGELWPALNFL